MSRPIAIIALVAAVLCTACTGANRRGDVVSPDSDIAPEASWLAMAYDPAGNVRVTVTDPWHPDRVLGRYVLVPRDGVVPDSTDGADVVRVPVESAAVMSMVHAAALAELGALECITGVGDVPYISPGDTLQTLLASGRAADLGPSASPDREKVTALRADVALISPMTDNDISGIFRRAGTVPLFCADYLEESPLGRAEWLKLMGALTGKRAMADSIYNATAGRYRALADSVRRAGVRPVKVLLDTEYSGIWYQPRGDTYAVHLLADGGATTATAAIPGTGAVQMDVPQVLADNQDARFWLLRSYGTLPTPADLTAQNPLYAHIPALHGGLYVCDTSRVPLFAVMAWHPDRLLAQYIHIFHPGLGIDIPASEEYFVRRK